MKTILIACACMLFILISNSVAAQNKNPVIIEKDSLTLPSTEEPEIYDFPEKEAEYPGGMGAMYKNLFQNINLQDTGFTHLGSTKLFLEFIVNTEGNVEAVKLLRSSGNYRFDQSALNAIKNMGQWTPAEHKGQKVKQRFKLPIMIHLE